jgi:hypothetical protein
VAAIVAVARDSVMSTSNVLNPPDCRRALVDALLAAFPDEEAVQAERLKRTKRLMDEMALADDGIRARRNAAELERAGLVVPTPAPAKADDVPRVGDKGQDCAPPSPGRYRVVSSGPLYSGIVTVTRDEDRLLSAKAADGEVVTWTGLDDRTSRWANTRWERLPDAEPAPAKADGAGSVSFHGVTLSVCPIEGCLTQMPHSHGARGGSYAKAEEATPLEWARSKAMMSMDEILRAHKERGGDAADAVVARLLVKTRDDAIRECVKRLREVGRECENHDCAASDIEALAGRAPQ